jgi:hypothetical protein
VRFDQWWAKDVIALVEIQSQSGSLGELPITERPALEGMWYASASTFRENTSKLSMGAVLRKLATLQVYHHGNCQGFTVES